MCSYSLTHSKIEFVFNFSHLFLELRTTILQRVCALLQVAELTVALQHVLHVLMHDADHLVDLGLLLRHLPGGLDLADLGRAGDGLPVGAQRPEAETFEL